jgi:hypothetical protein
VKMYQYLGPSMATLNVVQITWLASRTGQTHIKTHCSCFHLLVCTSLGEQLYPWSTRWIAMIINSLWWFMWIAVTSKWSLPPMNLSNLLMLLLHATTL